VWEWCRDRHAGGYYAHSPAKDPQGPASGKSRVLRGGSWGFEAWPCRSAIRLKDAPDHSNTNYGFRVVVSLR